MSTFSSFAFSKAALKVEQVLEKRHHPIDAPNIPASGAIFNDILAGYATEKNTLMEKMGSRSEMSYGMKNTFRNLQMDTIRMIRDTLDEHKHSGGMVLAQEILNAFETELDRQMGWTNDVRIDF